MALVTASRGLGNTITDELAKEQITYIDLLELHFSPVILLTNAQYNITLTTDTTTSGLFLSNGKFLSYELIKETNEAKVNENNIVCDAASTTLTDKFLNNDYVERRVLIYRQFINTTTRSTLGSPVMLFDGEIKGFTINEAQDQSTINIKSASVFYNFEDYNGRRTTQGSQQSVFPGDKGMNFAQHTTSDIKWGRPDAN